MKLKKYVFSVPEENLNVATIAILVKYVLNNMIIIVHGLTTV